MAITEKQIDRAGSISHMIETLQRDIDPEVLNADGVNVQYYLQQAKDKMILAYNELIAINSVST